MKKITSYFQDVETTEEHNGYSFSVGRTLTIVILGSICGLRNVSQIHQWASNQLVSEFLWEYFDIHKIPCYSWMLSLLGLIKPESLNLCFINWVGLLLPNKPTNPTVSFDGKTIRSTGKMSGYDAPLHIGNLRKLKHIPPKPMNGTKFFGELLIFDFFVLKRRF